MGLSRLISCQAKTLLQTELPLEMKLYLNKGVEVKGNLLQISMVVKENTFVRFILTFWNKAVFNLLLVEFRADDSITVEHHQNPRDPTQSHRPEYDAIVHPS